MLVLSIQNICFRFYAVHSICSLCRILLLLFRGGHQSYMYFLSPHILILKAQIIPIHSFITFLKLFFFNTKSSAFLLLCCPVTCIFYIFLQLLPTPLPTIYSFSVSMHIAHYTKQDPQHLVK